MHSMSLIDIDTLVGASYIYVNGEINLNQKSPISSGTIANSKYYTDIFNNITSPIDYTTIYDEYSNRNLTTPIRYDKLVMPYSTDRETTIELDLTIPSYQSILYTTPTIYSLKQAWIQYISLLLPGLLVIYLVLLFVFKFQVYDTAILNDLPSTKIN
jgi:hypothetical protein